MAAKAGRGEAKLSGFRIEEGVTSRLARLSTRRSPRSRSIFSRTFRKFMRPDGSTRPIRRQVDDREIQLERIPRTRTNTHPRVKDAARKRAREVRLTGTFVESRVNGTRRFENVELEERLDEVFGFFTRSVQGLHHRVPGDATAHRRLLETRHDARRCDIYRHAAFASATASS